MVVVVVVRHVAGFGGGGGVQSVVASAQVPRGIAAQRHVLLVLFGHKQLANKTGVGAVRSLLEFHLFYCFMLLI